MRSSGIKRLLRRLRQPPHAAWSPGARRRRARRVRQAGVSALVLAGAMLLLPLLDRGGAVAGAIATAVADPGAVFAQRSPGPRAPGALTQTKRRPTERVLTQLRTPPAAAAPPPMPAAAEPPPVELAALLPDDPFVPPFVPGEPFAPPPLPYVGPPPPAGPPPVIGPPPPFTGVPEPSTWAMLLVGFFAAGVALRRGRRVDAAAPAQR